MNLAGEKSAGGFLVLSLDFELHWGVHDVMSLAQFEPIARRVREVVPRMLELFQRYEIHATWATTGFLFFASPEELKNALPAKKPNYADKKISAYKVLADQETLGKNRECYFADALIDHIAAVENQEIASHTFSHYYCLEAGQSIAEFTADIAAAASAFRKKNLQLRSLVFPRNQVNPDYMPVLTDAQITAYRGNLSALSPDQGRPRRRPGKLLRATRLLDSYLNLTGHNAYALEQITAGPPFNIPASRFLRPYSMAGRFLEPLKTRRITDSLTVAAQRGLIYHLWWHPHNFGRHPQENLRTLETLLGHYARLHDRYGMESRNMRELAALLEQH